MQVHTIFIQTPPWLSYAYGFGMVAVLLFVVWVMFTSVKRRP